jgi:hypothetical protein
MRQVRGHEHAAEDEDREEPATLEVKDGKRRKGRMA